MIDKSELINLTSTSKSVLVKNIKKGTHYLLSGTAINATNSNDGELMILYKDSTNAFCREIDEFCEKFELVSAI